MNCGSIMKNSASNFSASVVSMITVPGFYVAVHNFSSSEAAKLAVQQPWADWMNGISFTIDYEKPGAIFPIDGPADVCHRILFDDEDHGFNYHTECHRTYGEDVPNPVRCECGKKVRIV